MLGKAFAIATIITLSCLLLARPFSLSPTTSKRLLRRRDHFGRRLKCETHKRMEKFTAKWQYTIARQYTAIDYYPLHFLY